MVAAQACLPFLDAGHPPQLRRAAHDTLRAVAQLDPDGVWLMLADLHLAAAAALQPSPPSAQLLPPRPGERRTAEDLGAAADGEAVAGWLEGGVAPPDPRLPPVAQLLPPAPWPANGGRAEETRRRQRSVSSGGGGSAQAAGARPWGSGSSAWQQPRGGGGAASGAGACCLPAANCIHGAAGLGAAWPVTQALAERVDAAELGALLASLGAEGAVPPGLARVPLIHSDA